MNNSTLPIIRIEIESMRQCMLHAFSQQNLQLDEIFASAVQKACDPERINTLMQEQAQKAIDSQIKAEVSQFFSYGPGRELIRDTVVANINAQMEYLKQQMQASSL